MVILAAMLGTSVLIFLVERHENEALRGRSPVSMGAMSVWYSLGNIMGYGADFHVTTISGRLLTVALYILSLVLVASYTANLASNLTISKTKNIINGIDDLKQGKVPLSRVGIRPNTTEKAYFLREISGESRSYYPLKSREEIFARLLAGDIDASFIDGPTGEYMTNTVYCNLTLVGPEFNARRFGIVAPKNWLYLEDFDMNVLALRELGHPNTLKKRRFESNVCQDAEDTPNAMSVESMAGLFLTVGVIVVVALLVLVWTKSRAIKSYVQQLKAQQYNVGGDSDTVTRPPH
jgi:polar amino acid transport system substrate-binding protein